MAKKQPELYRIPRKPGYLGGYDWRATALGCLLLVVVNFVATQYIAAKFQYQPALGAPILRAKSGGVYLRSRMGRNNARPQIVVVNFVATQYIAAKFQYQPALGAPILRAKSGGVYLRSRMGRNNARPLWNGQSDRSVEGVSLDRAQSADG